MIYISKIIKTLFLCWDISFTIFDKTILLTGYKYYIHNSIPVPGARSKLILDTFNICMNRHNQTLSNIFVDTEVYTKAEKIPNRKLPGKKYF